LFPLALRVLARPARRDPLRPRPADRHNRHNPLFFCSRELFCSFRTIALFVGSAKIHQTTENPEGFALAKTLTKSKKSVQSVATIDNRKGRDRRGAERRKEAVPVAAERRVGQRREKVNRRRQIDPTTCERDYTEAEVEFMHALDQYKRTSGRMFPTCSEVLEVLISLGYEKTNRQSGATLGTAKHCAADC
jgi:hypothetical protein